MVEQSELLWAWVISLLCPCPVKSVWLPLGQLRLVPGALWSRTMQPPRMSSPLGLWSNRGFTFTTHAHPSRCLCRRILTLLASDQSSQLYSKTLGPLLITPVFHMPAKAGMRDNTTLWGQLKWWPVFILPFTQWGQPLNTDMTEPEKASSSSPVAAGDSLPSTLYSDIVFPTHL